MHELVGEGERDAEPAGLGERFGEIEGQAQVILKLVEDDVDRMTAFRRDGGATEHRSPQPADDQAAEQRGRFFADGALGEIDQHDLALGENLAEVEARFGLAEDGA